MQNMMEVPVKTAIFMMILFSLSPGHALAWNYEEFKSGMSQEEIEIALQKRGLSDFVKRPIKGRPGAFVFQDRTKKNTLHFELCNELVASISIDITGNFKTFVEMFQVEEARRGAPTARVYEYNLESGIVATWDDKDSTFELFLASDIETGLSVAQSYKDKLLSAPCKE